MRIHAVYLDLDDTLCNSEELTPERLVAVREAMANDVEATKLDAVMTTAESWDSVGIPGKYPNRIARMAKQLGLNDEQTQRMRAAYNRVLMERLRLYDGVRDTLEWLHRRVPLGLITNGPSAFQRRKIELLGVEPYFRSITVSEEVGAHKPDLAIFRHALEDLGVEPAHAIYIGDRTEADVIGAQQAGITAIRVRRCYRFPMPTTPEPDYLLNEVTDLPDLMLSHGWLDTGSTLP